MQVPSGMVAPSSEARQPWGPRTASACPSQPSAHTESGNQALFWSLLLFGWTSPEFTAKG